MAFGRLEFIWRVGQEDTDLLASASDGLALGFITNIIVPALVERHRHIEPVAYMLVGLLLLHYLLDWDTMPSAAAANMPRHGGKRRLTFVF